MDLACFACQIACSAHNYHVHYNVFVPPPFANPGSTPESGLQCQVLLLLYIATYVLPKCGIYVLLIIK